MKENAHVFCARGDPMRQRQAEHPVVCRDTTNVFDSGCGRKIRSDAKGIVAQPGRQRTHVLSRVCYLQTLQTKSPWRFHQSLASEKRGRCAWTGCPGLKTTSNKRKRPYATSMRCEECSALQGKSVYLCNDAKGKVTAGGQLCLCHIAFHQKYHNKIFPSSYASAAASP